MKKIVPLAVLLVLFAGGLYLTRKSRQSEEVTPPIVEDRPEETPETIGGDKDEHGCLIAAGYSWCQEKQKCLREWEEPCQGQEVFDLLTQLEKETEIDFSGIAPMEFIWKTEEEDVFITGKSFDVSKIEWQNVEKIEDFFSDNGFKEDVFNVAAGTIASSTGYQKDDLVCQLSSGVSGYQEAVGQWVPENPNIRDVIISCGQLSDE